MNLREALKKQEDLIGRICSATIAPEGSDTREALGAEIDKLKKCIRRTIVKLFPDEKDADGYVELRIDDQLWRFYNNSGPMKVEQAPQVDPESITIEEDGGYS